MAVTPVIESDTAFSSEVHFYELTCAWDSSYPTGGEAWNPTGNRRLRKVWSCGGEAGYKFEWDQANQAMKVFYGDNNNASDGANIEVPNATDLSALTAVKFCAIGS